MSYPRAPLHDALAGIVMAKMSLTYGKRFSNSYPETITGQQLRDHFAQELAGISEHGIRYALDHLPADYVPNVLQLRLLATQRPEGEFKALPAPEPSPQVKQRGQQALQQLREQFLKSGSGVNIEWAQRIVANPQGKSRYAVRMATEVLRAHGRLA